MGTGNSEEHPCSWLAAAQHMCWDLLPACCLSASFELTYVSIAAHLSPSPPLFPLIPACCRHRTGPHRLPVTHGGNLSSSWDDPGLDALSCVNSLHPPLTPVTDFGWRFPPFPLNWSCIGAGSPFGAFDSLPSSSSSAPSALQTSVISRGNPGPAPTRIPVIRDTREAQRHQEPTCTCFSCCSRAPVAAASHFSSLYL